MKFVPKFKITLGAAYVYLAMLLLPGGSVIVLVAWLYRRRTWQNRSSRCPTQAIATLERSDRGADKIGATRLYGVAAEYRATV